MVPRDCSTHCPAVNRLIPIGSLPRLNRPSSITPSPDQPMARCGSHKNWLCKASMSVQAVCVWQRHDLLSKHDRLLRLEKTHREQTIELNDEKIRLLERFSLEFRERQIEVHYTGELVAVETFFVGALKGVGKVTVLNCYNRHAWRRLYTNKLPVTSVYVLNETVLPFFEAIRLGSISSCRTTCASSVGALTTIPTSCSFNWRGLSSGQPRYASRRATALSNGCIAHFWMNTSVSR